MYFRPFIFHIQATKIYIEEAFKANLSSKVWSQTENKGICCIKISVHEILKSVHTRIRKYSNFMRGRRLRVIPTKLKGHSELCCFGKSHS